MLLIPYLMLIVAASGWAKTNGSGKNTTNPKATQKLAAGQDLTLGLYFAKL